MYFFSTYLSTYSSIENKRQHRPKHHGHRTWKIEIRTSLASLRSYLPSCLVFWQRVVVDYGGTVTIDHWMWLVDRQRRMSKFTTTTTATLSYLTIRFVLVVLFLGRGCNNLYSAWSALNKLKKSKRHRIFWVMMQLQSICRLVILTSLTSSSKQYCRNALIKNVMWAHSVVGWYR